MPLGENTKLTFHVGQKQRLRNRVPVGPMLPGMTFAVRAEDADENVTLIHIHNVSRSCYCLRGGHFCFVAPDGTRSRNARVYYDGGHIDYWVDDEDKWIRVELYNKDNVQEGVLIAFPSSGNPLVWHKGFESFV